MTTARNCPSPPLSVSPALLSPAHSISFALSLFPSLPLSVYPWQILRCPETVDWFFAVSMYFVLFVYIFRL